jgi:hypothetical protein
MKDPAAPDDSPAAGRGESPGHPGLWGRSMNLARAARSAVAALPAWPFLVGVALGFGVCCAAGRVVSNRALFEHFVRFHGPIQPSHFFYPTASELVSQVRRTVPRTKYLVVVGGASYFRGTGQNADELWTVELQRMLGDDYAVVNYANDAAGVTAFAAVPFQVLSREYPRIAYVVNASPVVVDAADGGEVYRYVFWDAYYKGMIPLSAPWSDQVRDLARDERKSPSGLELHLGKWTDQFTYACDLWTYVGYEYFFTVWTDGMFDSVTRARRLYPEADDPYLAQEQLAFRQNANYERRYEALNKDYATKGFVPGKSGKLVLDPSAFDVISQLSVGMFPDNLKSRCFLVLVRSNPYFMREFTADDWSRHEEMYRQGQLAFERAGYRVVQLPDSDFTQDDYIDAGHYMASGGRKVAKAVAAALTSARAPAVP